RQSGRTRLPASSDDDAFASAGPGVMPAADGADLFGAAPVLAHGESGRVRGRSANGAGASGKHDGGRIENLTAQRSENSVLFSLSNLQSLASPAAASAAAKQQQGDAPAAAASSEGSGLIDIRAMAASTLRAPAPSAGPLPTGGGFDTGSRDEDMP